MSFVEPITIKEAIENVDKKNYLLPAIQREFVWGARQIERLFDSLMRDYPISSFLFWQVDKNNIDNYQFYEFVRNFHERDNRHNPKANLSGNDNIIAILDGQQRLTSLYIGLKGSYAFKLPRKRWDNNSAFPKRILCLNLLKYSEDNDLEYDFKFLTSEERKQKDPTNFWFPVGNILDIKEYHEINDYLIENVMPITSSDNFKLANKSLFKLFRVIQENKAINFFLEKDESLDKVLNIFIRVNSGGTQLSYSDLLLSIATAQWKEKDAREEITEFVDEINAIGNGFNINKDFVLKSCLVLGGFKDIAFKVDNFNQENMLQIESKWEHISSAIRNAFFLISGLGYHRETLTSNNAVIPIAQYIYSNELPSNFAEASKFSDDRKLILKWLIIVLLKRTFSGQPDNVLRPIREVINNHLGSFPYAQIETKLKGSPKSIIFDDDEIDNLLFYQYGQSYTYSALALIYPTLDFRNKFHQDHIFPKKLFTKKRLQKKNVPEDKIEFYLNKFNSIANLQLLEGVPNQEKSGKDFSDWMAEKYPNEPERKHYMEKHYIPDVEADVANFEEFILRREQLLIDAFKKAIFV